MFLNLMIFRNVPRDPGSQDPIFLHVWQEKTMSEYLRSKMYTLDGWIGSKVDQKKTTIHWLKLFAIFFV